MPELAGITYTRRGAGSPLVLVHGIGSRREAWSPVMDQLATYHDVIAVDLPGFGVSPKPSAPLTPGIPSLCGLLESFFAQLGISSPHVAGNSMGGWIVLELARRGVVASSTALSPGGFHVGTDRLYTIPQIVGQRVGARFSRPLAPVLFKSVLGRKLGWSVVVAHPERVPTADAVLGVQGMADATWFWPTFWNLIRSNFEDGSTIDVPVTIAWGDKDRLLLPHQAALALARIPSARFASLTDCGHMPMFDDPELVTRVILETTGALETAGAASQSS